MPTVTRDFGFGLEFLGSIQGPQLPIEFLAAEISSMAWTLIASTSGTPGQNGGATSAIDCTGADLIVVGITAADNGTVNFTDSENNTWTEVLPGGIVSDSGGVYTHLLYCFAPTVSASQTFSSVGSSFYPVIQPLVFSGSAGSGTYDQRNSNNGFGGITSLTLGSITPSKSNTMIVAFMGNNNTAQLSTSINNGIVAEATAAVGFSNQGGYIAYYNQATAGAIDQTFSWTGAGNAGGIVASFLPAASSGVSGSLNETIADFTLAGTGIGGTAGDLSETVADFTLDGTGSVGSATTGILNETIADFILAGTGLVGSVSGNLDQTYTNFSFVGQGLVGSIQGSLDITFADFTLNGSGMLPGPQIWDILGPTPRYQIPPFSGAGWPAQVFDPRTKNDGLFAFKILLAASALVVGAGFITRR